jgi:hypothetical protein
MMQLLIKLNETIAHNKELKREILLIHYKKRARIAGVFLTDCGGFKPPQSVLREFSKPPLILIPQIICGSFGGPLVSCRINCGGLVVEVENPRKLLK